MKTYVSSNFQKKKNMHFFVTMSNSHKKSRLSFVINLKTIFMSGNQAKFSRDFYLIS